MQLQPQLIYNHKKDHQNMFGKSDDNVSEKELSRIQDRLDDGESDCFQLLSQE